MLDELGRPARRLGRSGRAEGHCGSDPWAVACRAVAEHRVQHCAGEKGQRETEKCLEIVLNPPICLLMGGTHGGDVNVCAVCACV